MRTFWIIIGVLLGLWLFYHLVIKNIYHAIRFKRRSPYPCFAVVSQDGFIKKDMYYKDAKRYSDSIYGTVYVDDVVYKEFKEGKKNCTILN